MCWQGNSHSLSVRIITYVKQLASQSDIAFNRFQNHVNQLCDSLRSEDKTCKSRTAHHLEAITTTQELMPEEEGINEEECDNEADFDLGLDFNLPDSGYSTMDHTSMGEIQDFIDMFTIEADDPMNKFPSFDALCQPVAPIPQELAKATSFFLTPYEQSQHISSPSVSNNGIQIAPPNALRGQSEQPYIPQPSISPQMRIASSNNKYRCHCGYEPTGSEEWKASNFARHKRTQHAAAAKLYRCRFPGCLAEYKRSDNLRAHLKLKHGGDSLMLANIRMSEGDSYTKAENSDMTARPPKRRKRGEGSESVLQ